MKLKGVNAKIISNSRGEETIDILVKTNLGTFSGSAPGGKSVGKHETPSYTGGIKNSLKKLKDVSDDVARIEIEEFFDLEEVEKIVDKKKFGANISFALESAILKALATDQGKQVWELIEPKAKKFPFPVGNCIGGGKHTRGYKTKPEFQEFEVIPKVEKFIDCVFLMKKAHEICGNRLEMLGAKAKLNDENAWSTTLPNEMALTVLKETREEIVNQLGKNIEIGLDIAASSFFENGKYVYENPKKVLNKEEQLKFLSKIIEDYELHYIEDPFQEEDFDSFGKLKEDARQTSTCLIVGDDLTATQLDRFKEAIKKQSISAMIVKPNQNGSLMELWEIMKLAKTKAIKTIISHRSGETMDYILGDLAFGYQADYIKTGVMGKEREIKLQRLINIEKDLIK